MVYMFVITILLTLFIEFICAIARAEKKTKTLLLYKDNFRYSYNCPCCGHYNEKQGEASYTNENFGVMLVNYTFCSACDKEFPVWNEQVYDLNSFSAEEADQIRQLGNFATFVGSRDDSLIG